MNKTKHWAVWHLRDEETKSITVKVKPWVDSDIDGIGPIYIPGNSRYLHKMKFRTLTAKAAARRYIRNNLFGIIAMKDSCPCCCMEWTDDGDRRKLNWGLRVARKEYTVNIEINKE